MFQGSEWSSFRSPSVRIGGFGPWFSGGLVLALVALVAAAIYRMARRRGSEGDGGAHPGAALLSVAGICLLATLAQPSAFLARFAPQLRFVPVLIAIAVVLLVASA